MLKTLEDTLRGYKFDITIEAVDNKIKAAHARMLGEKSGKKPIDPIDAIFNLPGW